LEKFVLWINRIFGQHLTASSVKKAGLVLARKSKKVTLTNNRRSHFCGE
jgi:hypothetical protein